MNSDMVACYRQRANEYEKIYARAERQDDLLLAGKILQNIFADKDVFEVACGTGYWTERIAKTARSVLATDINDAVIEIAGSKNYGSAKVDFQKADIFELSNSFRCKNLFGGFIWSHVRLEELNRFISIINGLAEQGGSIVFIDNNYVEGSSLPVRDTDEFGNTYQLRTLENGTMHRIVKNFPTENFLRRSLGDAVMNFDFKSLQYYWILRYKIL